MTTGVSILLHLMLQKMPWAAGTTAAFSQLSEQNDLDNFAVCFMAGISQFAVAFAKTKCYNFEHRMKKEIFGWFDNRL